jgi:hypothetical protein
MRWARLSVMMLTLLGAAVALGADEKLYLTRTFDFDFRKPGRITVIDPKGEKPLAEQTLPHTWTMLLPKAIRVNLSICDDNKIEDFFHIRVFLKDEDVPANTVEAIILPDDGTKTLWVGKYRLQFTMIRKDANVDGKFARAVVKLEVFAPK